MPFDLSARLAERQAADKASADMDREIAEAGASLNPGVFVTA